MKPTFIRLISFMCILTFWIFNTYLFESGYSAELNSSSVSIDIQYPLINIESVSYPSFPEIDLANKVEKIHPDQDLAIRINDYDSHETNLKIKYSWDIISNTHWADKPTLSIGKGVVDKVALENTSFQYNSIDNINISEHTYVELVNLKNKECKNYEYRVSKNNITLNMGSVPIAGTYYIHQTVLLMYVQENN